MVHWSPFETVLEPDDDDPPGTQFYGMSVYPDRGVYFGLLWVYHANALMIDVQLAFSRDGIQWQRAVRRHPILSYGLPNQFDSHILIALQPILMGDELKVFYLAEDNSGFGICGVQSPSEQHLHRGPGQPDGRN